MRTKQQRPILRSGITLMEVLIAIFVVGIGLLGVLAVIPFGAFQVSKENHARHASIMLANATEEIRVRNMVNPERWVTDNITKLESENGNEVVFERVTVTVLERKNGTRIKTEAPPVGSPDSSPIQDQQQRRSVIPMLNCTKFIWYEPRKMNDPDEHIFCVSTFVTAEKWDEVMRGQDDLDYTTYADKRPDAGQKDKIQSSGKYTWFFTFLPGPQRVKEPDSIPTTARETFLSSSSGTGVRVQVGFEIRVLMNTNPLMTLPAMPLTSFPPVPPMDRVPLSPVPLELGPLYTDQEYPNFTIPTWYSSGPYFTDAVCPTVDVDVLACYNRVPTDDKQVACTFSRSLRGGTFTLPDASLLELLTQTKYVFATWETGGVVDGVWCKIVFVDKSDQLKPKMIVTTVVPGKQDVMPSTVQVYIPSGVLYHKRLQGVEMRKE